MEYNATIPKYWGKIVEEIPFLQDTSSPGKAEWGWLPRRIKSGEEISILAPMFSIVDAFDVLTEKMTALEALEYLREQTGILFDPKIVDVFEKLVTENQSEPMTKE